MRIGIATVQVPFVRGGAELLAESLLAQIRAAGHEAEILAVPFKWYPPERILDHVLACRLLDVTESNGTPIDRLIGLKFPAYLIPHPDKVLWLLHQHRPAYDLWDTAHSDLRLHPDGDHVRRAVVAADRLAMAEARAVYTISRNVTARLRSHCGTAAATLHPPPPHEERFGSGEWGDYLLFPSRLNSMKRQSLALTALRRTRHPVKVVFMGIADDPLYGRRLAEESADLGRRAVWAGGVSETEKYRLYADCRAVLFPPHDEDLGYVTLEAMLSEKAVVTCDDSGGPLEFVDHGCTGLVCPPDPDSLAAAMDLLWEDRDRAREYGIAGRRRYRELGIGWPAVLDRLLG